MCSKVVHVWPRSQVRCLGLSGRFDKKPLPRLLCFSPTSLLSQQSTFLAPLVAVPAMRVVFVQLIAA